tara:strand:- start:271 stop:447 length:177 start_codon:yes stop_codon:yes gene_type:complete
MLSSPKAKAATIVLCLALFVGVAFPRLIGYAAGEIHSAYSETMRARAIEDYRARNPLN